MGGATNTHIAYLLIPLTKTNAVWLEDLSERFPAEWLEVQTQVRLQGGGIPKPSTNTPDRVGPQIRVGPSNCLRLQQWQVQRRLDEVFGFTTPRLTVFIDDLNLSDRSILSAYHHVQQPPGMQRERGTAWNKNSSSTLIWSLSTMRLPLFCCFAEIWACHVYGSRTNNQ